MILESIFTQRTLEKDTGQQRRPKPEAEKRGVWPGTTLFTENTRKVGMILLMTGDHKEPIATGSVINRCKFLMKSDKTFKGNCIHKTLVIIRQADRETDYVESKDIFWLYIRNVMNLFMKYLLYCGFTCQQS